MHEPWRYRCPNGHVGVQRKVGTDKHGPTAKAPYYCDTCRKYGDDPFYHHLIDAKTDREVTA